MMFTKDQFKEALSEINPEMGNEAFIKFCRFNAELIEEAIKIAAGV